MASDATSAPAQRERPVDPVAAAMLQPPGDTGAPLWRDDEWQRLCALEAQAVEARRRQLLGTADAGDPALQVPRVGLALSGGGVRSATFALGLMRGLAQDGAGEAPRAGLARDGLLGRLDYLSTVSGGGYVGAMYGRLVAGSGMAQAQRLMRASDSPVLGWLRRNGRYLTPGGSRDTGIAVVTYLRAWLAIHAEFMFACIAFGLLVILPHLWQHSTQTLDAAAWEIWLTPWWALALALWCTLAPGLIAGYWAARDGPDPGFTRTRLRWRDASFVLIVAAGAVALLRHLYAQDVLDPVRNSLTWPGAGTLALGSVVAGQVIAMGWVTVDPTPHALKVARLRNALTRQLRWVMLATLALLGIGALDRLSWWILEEFQTGNVWLWRGVGAGSLAVLVLRALVQPLQKIASETVAHAREWLAVVLEIGSICGMLALVLAWLVLLQWFVFAPDTFTALRGVPAWMRATLLGTVWLTWVALSAGNAQMANTSSLHSFYRARLTRAYLAVGNRQRDLTSQHGIRADVTRVVDGDDTALQHYQPEAAGGPIHLISTCLNQTRDDSSGLYNADRKGTAVTASWRGFEVGAHRFVPLQPQHDAGTLGRWIAVSGAAASPGAGAYTSRGLALLLYFLGVRLGHWMRAPRLDVRLRWLSALSWRLLPKPMMLASEASATFFGIERPWWYLSDGGHFENTGVYALLKRDLDFIILSDAGADARFEFADLENLVRKARIDFGAEIDFYSREEAARLLAQPHPEVAILSPEDMGNVQSRRGVLLARIRYRERPGAKMEDGTTAAPWRPEGTLLVIKPNLHDALDLDLLAYARKHPDFPHESTGDQAFDEAQWESYHRLGEDFGRALHDPWLSQLPGWSEPALHRLEGAAPLATPPVAATTEPATPLWRRKVQATAIGTTLGIGASGTLLLSLWQVQDQLQRNQTDQQTEARQLFTEVSKGLQALDGTCPDVPEHLVTQTAMLLDLRESPSMRPLEQAGLERLAARITDECNRAPAASAQCADSYRRVQAGLCTLVRKPALLDGALSYWHPGASPQEQSADTRQVLSAAAAHFPALGGWLPAPPAAASATATAAAAAATVSLASCARADAPSTLYIHIQDEASREAASALRQALQADPATPLLVAPIENLVRNARLRQQRPPVPWPTPTLVLHDQASRACATAIAQYVGPPWRADATAPPVRLRDLPAALPARAGAMELWLPPLDAGATADARPAH